jgi:hypothetical protein
VIRAALFLLLASSAHASDPFLHLKPLYGTWKVKRDCKVFKDEILVEFSRLEKTVLVQFRSPKNPEKAWGKADVVYNNQEDHYLVFTAVPDHPVTKSLGLQNLQGHLSVSDDPDLTDGPGHDYLTLGSDVPVITSELAVKLRSNYSKATFTFRLNSPLGGQRCSGTGAKVGAVKAPASAKVDAHSPIND